MKTRIILTAIGLGMLLMLSGCSKDRETEAAVSSEPSAAASAAVVTPEPTEQPTPEPTPVSELALTGTAEWADVEQAVKDCPALRKLDLTESGLDIRANAAALSALELDELLFRAELCGTEITQDTEIFMPTTVPGEEDLPVLKLLKRLSAIDLRSAPCEPEQILFIRDAFPEQELLWQAELCGVTVGPDTETLNYNDVRIDSLEPFYRMLPLLPKLSSLEMCGCGVGNEEMDALRSAFPDAGVVWSIKSRHWTVRTDADHFATWRIDRVDENGLILEAYNIHFNTNEDLDWLKYCHDMVALDVGHNWLTNCEFVRNMPKLKYLIIADNKITDLSPLSDLQELIYLEIFVNPISDLTPLAGLKKLLDINMCSCGITDLTPLYGLPLERVWMTPYEMKDPNGAAEAFRAAVPGCDLEYIVNTHSTGDGWRQHERYREMRLALGRAKP